MAKEREKGMRREREKGTTPRAPRFPRFPALFHVFIIFHDSLKIKTKHEPALVVEFNC